MALLIPPIIAYKVLELNTATVDGWRNKDAKKLLWIFVHRSYSRHYGLKSVAQSPPLAAREISGEVS
ncbi:MAG: hypothetical protein K0R28_2753 [Paenibacillus sp.]|nr:hypothetical protein [Paenibacillus sp.]